VVFQIRGKTADNNIVLLKIRQGANIINRGALYHDTKLRNQIPLQMVIIVYFVVLFNYS
jgi:hypothetical protein